MNNMETSPFKADLLCGYTALVTGGGSGIGYEIALQLGQHGAKIVIMGRRTKVLDLAVDSLRKNGVDATSVQGDVRKEEDAQAAVQLAVEKYGSLDILVNSAAGNFLCPADNLSTKGYKTVMDIDAVGVFNMSRAAHKELKQSRRGSVIINISATLHYGATWYQVHASSAKAAIDSITRTLGLEWGQDGIRPPALTKAWWRPQLRRWCLLAG
eukprot:Colp12_sorted_trinity150504_noHs@12599